MVLLVLFTLPSLTEAAFVRANCRGIQELSTTEAEVSCQESSVLSDDEEHLMLGHTRAAANLARGRLSTSAAGGQIRDVGWNGGEAGALFMDRLTIRGDWQGYVAVTVRMCVAYRFAGFGESRIDAALRTSSSGKATGANQARVRLRHRGFGGTALADFESRGEFTIPEQGPRAPQAVFELTVTERVQHNAPTMSVRADIAAIALPNLESLEPALSSFSQSVALIAVSLPGRLTFTSESGVFLSEAGHARQKRLKQGANRSWVIMKATDSGNRNALRSHRGWHRAAARPDCRHELGLDG
jgi:hypothetical protein